MALEKGDPQRVLIAEARKWEADSIFVGGRRFGRAFERFWLGSVSTALVTKAHCSVEVVRGAMSQTRSELRITKLIPSDEGIDVRSARPA